MPKYLCIELMYYKEFTQLIWAFFNYTIYSRLGFSITIIPDLSYTISHLYKI